MLLDPEELADEVFEVGSDLDHQLGSLFAQQRPRIFLRSEQPVREPGIAGPQVFEKSPVQADKTFARVEVAESKAKCQREVVGCNTHSGASNRLGAEESKLTSIISAARFWHGTFVRRGNPGRPIQVQLTDMQERPTIQSIFR